MSRDALAAWAIELAIRGPLTVTLLPTEASMIEFDCQSCGKDYSVNGDKAGQRGKCPNCGNIMVVPETSTNEMIFEESEITVANPRLQRVYETIQEYASTQIIRQFITNQGSVLLEVRTGEYDNRSQLVLLMVGEGLDDDLIVHSKIGVVGQLDSLETALRYANEMLFVSVCLNEDNELLVRMLVNINKPAHELMILILMLAGFADRLEEDIFGWDAE